MKTFRIIILFTTIFSMVFISSCKKDDDTNPNNNAPQYQVKTITIPEAMAQSSDPGAQMAVNYLNMANNLAVYSNMMSPPKSAFVSQLKDGGAEIYTWDVNDGEKNNYSVTLKITETSEYIHWEMIIDGLFEGMQLHNFTFIMAEQYKDGSDNTFTIYDPENPGTVFMKFNWHESDGTFYLTIVVPGDIQVIIIVNADGSGSIEAKEWENGLYMLTYKAQWEASGHCEYWEYDNGEEINHGSW